MNVVFAIKESDAGLWRIDRNATTVQPGLRFAGAIRLARRWALDEYEGSGRSTRVLMVIPELTTELVHYACPGRVADSPAALTLRVCPGGRGAYDRQWMRWRWMAPVIGCHAQVTVGIARLAGLRQSDASLSRRMQAQADEVRRNFPTHPSVTLAACARVMSWEP